MNGYGSANESRSLSGDTARSLRGDDRGREEELRRQLRVYFIMGSNNCRKDPARVLKEAITGGITMFQYREKGAGALEGSERMELAAKLRMLCRESGIPFIVNDDVELALALDADGVHIGQEDESAAAVRRRIGGHRILGVSAYDGREAELAIRSGADYLGVGPVYATRTKQDAKEASGVGTIARIRDSGMRIPLVGIGGIHAGNAADVIRAGADGVSVITAISLAEDIRGSAETLLQAVNRSIGF